MSRAVSLLIIQACFIAIRCYSQNESVKINDVLFSHGLEDLGAEYYVVDSKNSFLENHLLFQPRINDNNILSIEGVS